MDNYYIYFDSCCAENYDPSYDQKMMDRTLKSLAINAKKINIREKIIGCGNIYLNNDLVYVNATPEKKDSLSTIKTSKVYATSRTSFTITSLHYSPMSGNGSITISVDILIHVLKCLRINDYCNFFSCSKDLYKVRHQIEQKHIHLSSNIQASIPRYGISIEMQLFLDDEMQLSIKETESPSYQTCFLCHKPIDVSSDTANHMLRYELETAAFRNRGIYGRKRCDLEKLEKSNIYAINACDDCKCYNIPKFEYAQATCSLMNLNIPFFFTFHIKKNNESYFRQCCLDFFQTRKDIDAYMSRIYLDMPFDGLRTTINRYIWKDVVTNVNQPFFCANVNCDDYSYSHLHCIHFEVKPCPDKNKCKNTDSYHRKYFYHSTKKCKFGPKCTNKSHVHQCNFTH